MEEAHSPKSEVGEVFFYHKNREGEVGHPLQGVSSPLVRERLSALSHNHSSEQPPPPGQEALPTG